MSIDEMIDLLQAMKAGKTIQWKHRMSPDASWTDIYGTFEPWRLNFRSFDYRVKPELRTFWVAEYEHGSLGCLCSSKEEAIGITQCMGGFKGVVKLKETSE